MSKGVVGKASVGKQNGNWGVEKVTYYVKKP
jgi:hypothetical protein